MQLFCKEGVMDNPEVTVSPLWCDECQAQRKKEELTKGKAH
jgi:hypothetical protein